MYLVLALSTFLLAVEASIWPYHGSVAPATGAVIAEYLEAPEEYGIEALTQQRISLGHSNGPVTGSLAANPIIVKGPDASSKAIIGPSEGPVLVQGPQAGSATVIGPSEGPARIVGPSSGGATIVGPSAGQATIVGPSSAGATIIGPSEGAATIVGPSSGGATIIGPSAGAATIVGPKSGGATIVGPSSGPAIITGPISKPAVIGNSIADAHAHAEAHAYAEAHAHNHVHSPVYIERPRETVHVKEIIPQTTIIRERPHSVVQPHNHYVSHPLKQIICGPALRGWETNAAVNAVAEAASHYGPVHVSSAQGRPVVTISGATTHHHHPEPILGPVAPVAVIRGPSGSISTASASASAVASSHGGEWVSKMYWYPGPVWRKC